MRTDRDGAPLAAVDAEDAAQHHDEGKRPDPTATLTPTQALAWAATTARRATNAAAAFNAIDDDHPHADGERGYFRDRALLNAAVSQALVAYATATGRWQGR